MNYFIQFLTYFRILIAPIIFLLITFYDSYGFALLLFILASISDYWDGFLARKYKLESIVGEVLDPIADKILSLFVILSLIIHFQSLYIAFLGGVILSREFLVSALRDLNARRGTSNATKVTYIAKFKTTIQFITFTSFLFGIYYNNAFLIFISYQLLLLAVIITVYTGFVYTIETLKYDEGIRKSRK